MPTDLPHARIAHLHCLYCGGERRGDDSACRKCLAEAPSVPCRKCKAAVFAPRDVCICGERCTAWSLAEDHDLPCPRCKGRLGWVAMDEGAIHVEQCARCMGCFARTADFSEILDRESHHESVHLPAFVQPPGKAELPRQDLLAEAKCPHCEATMERVRFNQKAAIVVDVCPKHGVWLDAGELPRLLDYLKQVADGSTGLDEADRADQQHWDHVMTERLSEERIIDASIASAEARAYAHRTRNVLVGTAVGGPWVGLFMAMRGGRPAR